MGVSQYLRAVLFGLLLCGTGNAVVYPLKISSTNPRILVDQNSTPFPIMGRTAWFVLSVSVGDYHTFVDDTATHGYNAIELHVINHDPRGHNPPFNGNGDLPFLKRLDGTTWNGSLTYGNISAEAPDFATPNGAYWSFVDGFLSYCESKRILVFLFPAYVGYTDTDQGWMQEMVANGDTKMQSYGAWIATRYKNQPNLVWMMGGDMGTPPNSFNTAQTSVVGALLTGLKSVTGQRSVLFSAEWDSGSIATDQASFGASMNLNGVYSWTGDVNSHGRRAYTHSPAAPAFLLEEPYDEEGPDGNNVNPSATQPVRRFQWWGWLSTIGGYVSGNAYVWRFNSPDWENHLNTQGSRDMARLNSFIGSIAWYNLIPSGLNGMRTLITAGGSSVSSSDYVTAAANPDGTLLVAYVPPAHSGPITVDMGAMSGGTRARWFDPTSGAYKDIETGLTNTGTRSFTTPGSNQAGDGDWVLVLETQPKATISAGSYNGLFQQDDEVGQDSVGFLTASVNSKGAYSGRLHMGTGRYSFKGQFDLHGRATNFIVRSGSDPLTVEIRASEQADQITGSVSDGNWSSSLIGYRNTFNSKTNPAGFAGQYTMIIPGQGSGASLPAGDGFGTVRIGPDGKVKFVGLLADGTKISQSAQLSKNGDWPLYLPLYAGKGSLVSWITFTNLANSYPHGKLSWIKPADTAVRFYPNGFTYETAVVGSFYTRPVGGASRILNLTDTTVSFSGGNLVPGFTNSVAIGLNSRVANLSSNQLTLRFSSATGTFKGKVVDPAKGDPWTFNGAVLQRFNTASGFLAGSNQASRVALAK